MSKESREGIIYKSPDGLSNLSVQLEDETVWLTQKQLVELTRQRNLQSASILKIFTAMKN